uniref:Uncharacterized protein n=1 Tax=Arundo donax TaxID=35708 RepID=A0A0A8Y5C7_ARUDO
MLRWLFRFTWLSPRFERSKELVSLSPPSAVSHALWCKFILLAFCIGNVVLCEEPSPLEVVPLSRTYSLLSR